MVRHIQPGDHDGIGAETVIIGAHNEDIVKALLMAGGDLCFYFFTGLVHMGLYHRRRPEHLFRSHRTQGGVFHFHRFDKIIVYDHNCCSQHQNAGCQH